MPSDDSSQRRKSWFRYHLALPLLLLAAALCALAYVRTLGVLGALDNSPTLLHGFLTQEEGSGDENEIPPEQVEKYIKVYKATQRDRNLTVEQAAAQQGMTLESFREIEAKIERDDVVREHVRQALKPAAQSTP